MPKLAVLNTHPIQYFAPLYRRLAQEPGLEVTVYFCSRQGVDEYLDEGFGERFKWDTTLLDGYDHTFLPNLRRRDQVTGFWSLINFGIIRELRRQRYDALLVNGHNHASYLIAIVAAKFLGLPVFMRCETHLQLQRSPIKRAIRKRLMSFLYKRLCTACLPIGTNNRDFYRFHGVGDEKLFMVPYAVDNKYFTDAALKFERRTARDELGLPRDKPVVLFASKLIPRKRANDLLLAFQNVRNTGIDAALVFVGSGEDEAKLKAQVREQAISDVYFFGFRNQSELPKFYATADVFVLPSENEPWGLIINEVMCAGLPVIASKEIGAVTDLVRHGENGFTYEAGNIAELTEYLSQVLVAPEIRQRMSEASRRIIAQWDYERCVLGIKQAMAHVQPAPRAHRREPSRMNFSAVSNHGLVGKILRQPLKLVPPDAAMPILQGRLKGKRWIAGSHTHGCWLGSYEKDKQRMFEAEVKPGDTVFDIGANVGFYSLLASELVGAMGHVFAFEPVPRNLQFLNQHLRLNKVKNVQVIDAAVSDQTGETFFDDAPGSAMGHLALQGKLKVRTVTIDDLLAAGEIAPPNCLKIDVEGAESLVIEGARHTLEQFHPKIFLATHGAEVHLESCKMLRSLDYQLTAIGGENVDDCDELLAFRSPG